MSRLKTLFEALEFDAVETSIASGNVIFSSGAQETGLLETRIAQHLEAALSYPVVTFVRTVEDVAR